MKVGFHARHLSNPNLTGWNRYSINLLSALAGLGTEIVLYGNRPLSGHHLADISPEHRQVRVAPPMPYFAYEQGWLARQAGKDQLDVFHSPFNSGLPWFAPCAAVLTIHDAIVEKVDDPMARRMLWPSMTSVRRFRGYAGWRKDRMLERVYQRIARARADTVITGSEHAKGDLVSELAVPPARVSVIYHAAGTAFERPLSSSERQRVRTDYNLMRPYVFYIGSYQPRKNVSLLIRAFASARLPEVLLVLAGDPEHHGIDHHLIADLGLQDNVRCVGAVADSDLPAMYAQAACFVYPSLYEGFGLQLCEAMASGCPTLAADATSLPEVLGDGGEIFPVDDPERLGALIRRVVLDTEFAERLRVKGRERSASFSWRRTAEETLNVYEAAIALRPPSMKYCRPVRPKPFLTHGHDLAAIGSADDRGSG